MARQLRMQLVRRAMNPKIADCVPILRVFVNKLAIISGEQRQVSKSTTATDDDDTAKLVTKSTDGQLVRAHTWSEASRLRNKQHQNGSTDKVAQNGLKKSVTFGRNKTTVLPS